MLTVEGWAHRPTDQLLTPYRFVHRDSSPTVSITRDASRMTEISIPELRNHGGEIVDRVAQGERLTVTRDGKPVAQLLPLECQPPSIQALQRRWLKLPPMDPNSLRRDIDAVIDQEL